MFVNKVEIEERIRASAKNTDELITKLDTLTARIDMAKQNENAELIEYYERQFAETSVEFMDGVESILDDWYQLRGEPRPPASMEQLTSEDLDVIHSTVVNIVQGLSTSAPLSIRSDEVPEMPSSQRITPKKSGPKHSVDITG